MFRHLFFSIFTLRMGLHFLTVFRPTLDPVAISSLLSFLGFCVGLFFPSCVSFTVLEETLEDGDLGGLSCLQML